MKGRTDASESKVRTSGGQSLSDHILGCGRHVIGEICGGNRTVNQEIYFDSLIRLRQAIKTK